MLWRNEKMTSEENLIEARAGWKTVRDIPNNNLYKVDSDGKIYIKVKQDDNGKDLFRIKKVSNPTEKNKYITCAFGKVRKYVHRIVAHEFCPYENEKDERGDIKNTVDHLKGIKEDNSSRKLEWVSQKENNRRCEARKNENI